MAVQVLSVQPAATDGSVYPTAGGDIGAAWFSALASQDANGSFDHVTVASFAICFHKKDEALLKLVQLYFGGVGGFSQ